MVVKKKNVQGSILYIEGVSFIAYLKDKILKLFLAGTAILTKMRQTL